MPFFAYGYIRVSRDEQAAEDRMGLPTQEAFAKKYHEFKQFLPDHPLAICEWGGIFADEGASAFRVPFLRRKAGGLLDSRLNPGDQVIIPEYRRGFRDMYDLCITVRRWQERGIGLHYADIGLDLTTPMGKFMIQTMANLAELESANKSFYGKQIAKTLRDQGRPCTKRNGFRIVRRGKIKYEVPDADQRAIMQEIARLKDEEKMSWEQVSVHIESTLCDFEGREFKNSAFFKRVWSLERCRKVYRQWKKIVKEENQRKTG